MAHTANTDEKKSGFVALIGRPNVGKSTLLNYFLQTKVAITSNKPQTTRNRIRGILTDERGQIVFFDTPGMHKAKNRLGEYMMHAANAATKDVDVIVWLVEPDEQIGPGDRHIASMLQDVNVPVLLIINKADTVSHTDLLPVIDRFKDLYDFAEIFPVSALKGEGCAELLDSLFSYLEPGPYFYDEDALTDQPLRQMCAEIIREKALHALGDELPHGIAVVIEEMKLRSDKKLYHIHALLVCEKASHKGMIIGKGGAMLKKIGSNARFEMKKLLDKDVNLKIWVKVKTNWRDSKRLIENFGYQDDE